MLFRYDVDEGKKLIPSRGYCLCGVGTFCPCPHGFSPVLCFPPKDVPRGERTCLTVPVRVGVGVGVMRPVKEGRPVQGGFPPGALSCQDSL